MSTKRYAILAVWGVLGLALLLLAFSAGSVASPPEPAVSSMVSPSRDFVTVCPSGECDYTTIQDAVDAASDGDTIKVAQGVYTSPAFQVVYISKAITLTGGYTTTDWVNSYPLTQTTVIDAEGVTRRRGVYIDGTGVATITLAGLTIQSGNSGEDEGGGVYIATGVVVLRDSQVLDNRASSYYSGGIHAEGGTVSMIDSIVRGNSRCGLYAGQSVLTVTLTGNTFQDNAGRGVYITGPSSAYPGPGDGDAQSSLVTLTGNTFQGNSGGGVFLRDVGTAIVKDNSFQNNSSGDDQDGGGGLAVSYSGIAILNDNSFEANSALDGGGARITGGIVTLAGNSFRNNVAERYGFGWVCDGGGVCIGDSVATLTGNSFEGNTAEAHGGGIHAARSVITLTSNWFQGNRVIGSSSWPEPLGGGICVREGTTALSGNTILSNTAAYAGGGIAVWLEGIVNGSNDVIANNTSPFEGVHLSGGTLTAQHWTLVNNGSYAITTDGGSAILTNTIVASHAAGGFWGSDISADHTLFFDSGTPCGGGATCTNSISGDPAFVDPEGGHYHIGPDSAALDRGVATDVMLDMDHEPRPYQIPDLGADEYWPPGVLRYLYLPLIMRHH